MNTLGQQLTKQSYEDPQLVAEYIKKHSLEEKHVALIKNFASQIEGKKVLDLGCGPGHHSYLYSQLGFEVTGLDYSSEMIKQANNGKKDESIQFVVGDMTQLEDYFEEDTFDAVWASASLVHIPLEQVENVLRGITYVSKSRAKVYISLKGGQGTHVVSEDQYLDGLQVEREFTLWEKEKFLKLAEKYNLELTEFKTREGRIFQGRPTEWLMFFFTLNK